MAATNAAMAAHRTATVLGRGRHRRWPASYHATSPEFLIQTGTDLVVLFAQYRMERNEDVNGEGLRTRWIVGLSNAAARRDEIDDDSLVELLWSGVQILSRLQDFEGVCSLLDWYRADAALMERTRHRHEVIIAKAYVVQANLVLGRQEEAAELLTSLLDTEDRRERRAAILVSRGILMETWRILSDGDICEAFARAAQILISALRRRPTTAQFETLAQIYTALLQTYPADVRARLA